MVTPPARKISARMTDIAAPFRKTPHLCFSGRRTGASSPLVFMVPIVCHKSAIGWLQRRWHREVPSGFGPLDPGDVREVTVIREHLLDSVLPHDAKMYSVPSGEARIILQEPSGLRHRAIRDGEDRDAQVGYGVKEFEANLWDLE